MRRFTDLRILLLACSLASVTPQAAQAQFDPAGRRKKPSAGVKPAPTGGATTPKKPTPKQPTLPSAERPTPERPVPSPPPRADGDAVIERTFSLAFEHLNEEYPLERLVELVRARDGSIDALRARLTTTADAAGPHRFAALVLLGRLEERAGQGSTARAFYERALPLEPRRIEARLALARVELADGHLDRAATLLEEAVPLSRDAEREAILRQLRGLALDRSDVAAARKYQTELLRAAPQSALVRAELGRELLARGKTAEAIVELRDVVARSAGDARALGPAYRDLARAEHAAGDDEAAEKSVRRASDLLRSQPGLRTEVDLLGAEIARSRGRLDELLARWEKEPFDAPRARLLARLYEEQGRFDEARAAYRRVLERQPRDIDSRLALIRLLETAGKLADVLSEYAELVKSAPGDVALSLRYLEALRTQGHDARLQAELDRIERAASDADGLVLLLDFVERLEDGPRARRILAELERRGGTDASRFVEMGARHHRAGQKQTALDTWKKIVDVAPSSARAHVLYGEILLDHDESVLGVRALEHAVELAPEDANVRRSLALGYERALTLDPEEDRKPLAEKAERAWLDLLARTTGNSDESEQKRNEARRHLVRLWQDGNRLHHELGRLKRRFRATPPDLEAGRLLVEVEQKLGRLEDARATLRAWLVARPGDRAGFLRLAELEERAGALDPALDAWERVIALDPARARLHLETMARLALRFHDDARAVGYARRAVASAPNDAQAHARLAELELALGRRDEAEKSYARALVLDPSRHEMALGLAELEIQAGREDAGVDRLVRIVGSEAPDDVTAQATRRALRSVAASRSAHESQSSGASPSGRLVALEEALTRRSLREPGRPLLRSLLVEVLDEEMKRIEASTSARSPERDEALGRLARRAPGALLALLANGRLEERRTAVKLLAHARSEEANRGLLHLAQSSAPEDLRVLALEALDPRGREPSGLDSRSDDGLALTLAEMARETSGLSGAVPRAAASVLVRIPSARARELATGLLDHRDGAVRGHALGALTISSRREVPRTDALFERVRLTLDDTRVETSVRASAALALGTFPQAASVLDAQLEAADPRVASAALVARLELAELPEVATSAKSTSSHGGAHFDRDALLARSLVDPRPQVRRVALLWTSEKGAPSRATAAQPIASLDDLEARSPSAEGALAALARLEAPLTRALHEALDATPERAGATLSSFERSADGWLFSPFSDALRDAPKETRARALDVTRRVVSRLESDLRRWSEHPDARLRLAALQCASIDGSTSPDDAARSFERALRDPDEHVRDRALDLLGQQRNPLAWRLLDEVARTNEAWSVRRRVALAAQQLERNSRSAERELPPETRTLVTRILGRAAEDPSPLVRKSTAPSATP